MKKAKTNKKIFTIFSAVLGVVFAFLTGFTYCATSLNLTYGNVPNSTAAYLANQEYRIINDTESNPVLFGEGAHNFEVALQYSFDYSFDVRLKYSLSWTDGLSTDNVILHFADRDNIIYDEEYIYLADAVPAGNGKINIIAGVDFVDPTLKSYFGKKLEISIDEVKVYKEQPSYDGEHALMKQITIDQQTQEKTTTKLTGPASQAWLQYKKNKTTQAESSAYVLMYNYRRDYDHGVSFPGLESAYKKPVGSDSYVTGSTWAGGNRAYAGTGMFVIAGSENLELEVQVAGIWRSNKTPQALSTENSVQYNYTSDWNFKNYSSDKLWETRTFIHYIPARTACYIEINDSIEITRAGMETVLAKDEYRLVTNSIVLNPSLGANATTFTYLEKETTNEPAAAAATVVLDGYMAFKEIVENVDVAHSTDEYKEEAVSIINTSSYINGLYNTLPGGGQQSYNTNLSLINNTNQAQTVELNLDLWYHISNAKTKLYDSSNKRASELIGSVFTKPFNRNETVSELYYSYAAETNHLTETTDSFTVKLEPYASVGLLTSYSVHQDLGVDIKNTFDDPGTEDTVEYYDVWTYLVPSFGTVETSASSMLELQTTQTATSTVISVKNNSNSKVTGITLSKFSIRALGAVSFAPENGANAPYDWDASYWKYYSAANDDAQLKTKQTYVSGKFFKRTQIYGNALTVAAANFLNGAEFKTGESGDIVYSDSLLPGESVEILTFTTTSQVVVAGNVLADSISAPTDIEIVNNGTEDACIINYSSNSYYLKLNGTVTGSKFEKFDDDSTNSYYIGIVRPGQMIEVSLADEITISAADKIIVSDAYAETVFPENSWSAKAKAAMTSYFNMNKEQTN